jgi:hypothetical protein
MWLLSEIPAAIGIPVAVRVQGKYEKSGCRESGAEGSGRLCSPIGASYILVKKKMRVDVP